MELKDLIIGDSILVNSTSLPYIRAETLFGKTKYLWKMAKKMRGENRKRFEQAIMEAQDYHKKTKWAKASVKDLQKFEDLILKAAKIHFEDQLFGDTYFEGDPDEDVKIDRAAKKWMTTRSL